MALNVKVIILTGQSVNLGDSWGASVPVNIKFWNTGSVAWANMTTANPAKDVTLGLGLASAGYTCVFINLSQGSTSSDEWTPPSGSEWLDFSAAFATAIAALPAEFPAGTVFTYYNHHDQGERDAIYGPLAECTNWGVDRAAQMAGIVALVGKPVYQTIGLTKIPLAGASYSTELRAAQIAAAGSSRYYVNRDACEDSGDGVHPSKAGYIQYGNLILATYLGILPMGSLSTITANGLIDHVRNKETRTPDATHYMHLYAAGSVPISGNGYAVKSQTNNKTTYGAAASRVVANAIAWTFDAPTGTWPDVAEWKITNSATEGAGTTVASGTISPVPVSLATGPFSFAAGALTITGSAGGMVDAVVNGLLDLEFGGTAYTQLATTYGSYWAGDPQGAGAQAGSRVAMTQATVWGAASSNKAVSVASVSLTQQVTGTYWAEHDASVAGNLLFSAARPALTGASGTILPGQLQTTLT